MASFRQNEYCKVCKKNVSSNKSGKCPICNNTTTKGTWYVRFFIQEINGKKTRKTLSGFDTKKQANAAYINYISKNQYLKQIPNNSFEEAYNKYLNEKKLNTKESTLFTLENDFKRFIIPYFKNTNITEYSKDFLVIWQNAIWDLKKPNNESYSYAYLNKIRFFLNSFLNYCEIEYNIPNNLKLIKKPKDTSIKNEILFWEVEDFNRFIKYCNFDLNVFNDCLWYTYFIFSYYSGLRIGEIIALKENDIKNNILYINKTLSNKAFGKTYTITTTKNYKIYNKKLPDIALNAINNFLSLKKALKIKNEFLFGTYTPLPQTTIRRNLNKYIDLANSNIKDEESKLKRISPHGFRHSYVSLLIHLGCSTKTVAELIGDTEDMVITTYSHLYNDEKDNAINKINSFLV